MLYSMWLVGAIIWFFILLIAYINKAGVYVKCEMNDRDFSNVAAFFVIIVAALIWPITLLLCIINDSNS